MSINNPGVDDAFGCEDNGYEDFADLEYENCPANSKEALLQDDTFKPPEFFNEETLKREIDEVEKLRVEEVRWFYQSGRKKRWKPFIGADSILIETEWRCISKSDREINRVCVRGGMYEVDVLEKKCFPVYWSSVNLKGVEENVNILRGTWFYESNFMPLDEEIAEKVEAEHIERWKDCSLDEVKWMIRNIVMHSVKLDQCHVDWYSVNDVYIHSDAVSHRALRNIVQKFGASKTSTSGHKLRRGYREDAMYEDCMPPVDHLIFVVHGIGSKPDRQKIVRNTNELRLACERAAAKHFAHYIGRVEFLPVEWRSKLALDDGIVEMIMPKRSVGFRQFLNNSAMDIMFYTSPLYKSEIVDGLRDQISLLHSMFIQRNPSFHGKISIFAHSLGCVIMHDIMTQWSPEALFDDYMRKYAEQSSNAVATDQGGTKSMEVQGITMSKQPPSNINSLTLVGKPPELNFVVENFFCVGSPLGIFMALRGLRPSDGKGVQDDIIPKSVCHRIFNVYHPADPVAYRLEPLILGHYTSIAPLQVHSNASLQLLSYSEMPTRSYSCETSQEMANVSSAGFDQDSTTVDELDDCDEEESLGENTDSCDRTKIYPQSSHDRELIGDNDTTSSSPTLVRRSSYLKAISGGAARVGKALWGRARGSPTPVKSKEISSLPEVQDNHDSTHDTCDEDGKPVNDDQRTVGNSDSISKIHSGSFAVDAMELEYRLDYELQEGFTESKLGYASLTSHTSYWGNQDVALFLLMQIHPPSTMNQNLKSKI